MKTEKWYFNRGIYLKNIGRFWPIWAIYLVLWLAILPMRLSAELSIYFANGFNDIPRRAAELLTMDGDGGKTMLLMAFFFSSFVAMAVFRYLCTTASVGYYHSLPIRREGLFLSGWLSGITMLVGANVLVFAGILIVGGAWGVPCVQAALLWLITASVLCVFFFSFAAFCAQFTGSTIAQPVFYGILNMLAIAVYYIIRSIMNEVVYGLVGESGLIYRIVEAMSPPFYLWRNGFGAAVESPLSVTSGSWTLAYMGKGYLLGLLIAGLIFALLSLLVYRKRKSETAEDIVSVAAVRPIFKYGVAFCAALLGGLIMSYVIKQAFDAVTFGIFMAISGFVFCCVAEMLLKKSFKVFSVKKIISAIIFTAIMIVLLIAALNSGFGVENRIPAASKVETVTVSTFDYTSYLENDGYSYDANYNLAFIAENAEDIETVRQLHSFLLGQKGAMDDSFYAESFDTYGNYVYTSNTADIRVTYQMKNGSSVERHYPIAVTPALLEDENSAASVCLKLLESAGKSLPERYVAKNLDSVRVYYSGDYYADGTTTSEYGVSTTAYAQEIGEYTPEATLTYAKAQQLLEAVTKDLEAGDIGKGYLIKDETYFSENYLVNIEFTFDTGDGYLGNYTVAVSLTAKNTIAALEALDVTEDCPLVTLSDVAAAHN